MFHGRGKFNALAESIKIDVITRCDLIDFVSAQVGLHDVMCLLYSRVGADDSQIVSECSVVRVVGPE